MDLRVEGPEQVAEERPPTYVPQANGAVESVVGDVKGRLRTCVLGVEQRLRHKIPPDHPVITTSERQAIPLGNCSSLANPAGTR